MTLPAGEELLLRAFPPKPLVATHAENATLWTPEGKAYTDLGGASQGVAVIGHNHPRVVAAIREQAETLIHAANTVPSPVRGQFLRRLHALLPPELARTFLTNSGTEAIECAIKLAVAATGRGKLVACRDSFHGRTLGSLAATSKPQFRDPFLPILPSCSFTPFNDVEALKSAVNADTAALILEPVQGEGGIRPATTEYLRAARDVTQDRGATLVFDEVQSGMGRTGTFLRSQALGVVPDAACIAKGLAGGVPVGACSVSAELAAKLPPGGHGSTYGGSPLACAAGTATLDVLAEEGLMDRATRLGDRLMARLAGAGIPVLRQVRGAGLMVGLDLRVRPQAALDGLARRGVLALPGGATGIRLLPPLTIPEHQLDAAVEAVLAALAPQVTA